MLLLPQLLDEKLQIALVFEEGLTVRRQARNILQALFVHGDHIVHLVGIVAFVPLTTVTLLGCSTVVPFLGPFQRHQVLGQALVVVCVIGPLASTCFTFVLCHWFATLIRAVLLYTNRTFNWIRMAIMYSISNASILDWSLLITRYTGLGPILGAFLLFLLLDKLLLCLNLLRFLDILALEISNVKLYNLHALLNLLLVHFPDPAISKLVQYELDSWYLRVAGVTAILQFTL